MKKWSTLKKLIWLYAVKLKGGASAIIETITGNLPLVLRNAVNHAIVSLTRYGLCTQDGTPTPSAPVDIMCNNGVLQYVALGKNLNGGTIENKGYTSTGGQSTSTTFAGTLWKIPCKEGDKFTVSWDGFTDGVSGVFINTWLTDGTWNARQAISASTSLTYTVGAGVGIINFTLYKTGGITIGDNAWIQVEYGTSVTPYEPFAGMGIKAEGTPELLTVRPGEHLVLSASDFTQDSATKVKTAEFIAVQPGTDYVYAFDMVDTVSGVKYENDFETYDADGNKLRSSGFGNTNGCRSGQFTANSNEVKVKVNIHCKSSSDTITPADIVSFAFDTQSTSYDPAGKNLFNRLNCVYGSYLNNSGNPTSNSTPSCYSCPIPVDSSKTYTFSGISSNVGNNNKRVCFYQADDSFISAQASAVTNADVPYSLTFTPPANTAYCRLSLNTADTEVMLEEGSTQTAYESYIDASWQTASVPMLLSVGDYKDETDLISGIKTGKAGIHVFDGTESVSASGTGWATPIADKLRSKVEAICTHYPYSSATMANAPDKSFITFSSQNVGFKDSSFASEADVKAFFFAQYAAGTPVIVVYPLAEETTEHIMGQNLVTNEGTNVVDSVANVSPLEAKVKYMTASAQDVLSTLLGMKVTKQDISTQDAEDIIDIITGEDNK